jgi:hypothetical protein
MLICTDESHFQVANRRTVFEKKNQCMSDLSKFGKHIGSPKFVTHRFRAPLCFKCESHPLELSSVVFISESMMLSSLCSFRDSGAARIQSLTERLIIDIVYDVCKKV